jgi:hypothetical protein
MNNEASFERENRYIVIKLKRLQEGAREPLRRYLEHLNVKPVECVVVEVDWPEYEKVWSMIEARCASIEDTDDDCKYGHCCCDCDRCCDCGKIIPEKRL